MRTALARGNETQIDLVVGARPNLIKLRALHRALRAYPELGVRIVHTGQHYDLSMSGSFFHELEIPAPAVELRVRSGHHGEQTARILQSYERHLLARRPDAVVVFGDVNSTLACALAAAKLCIPVAHVEAGLRSFDRSMPEEVNRVLTDAIADLLLVSEPSGTRNLRAEGVADNRIHEVGNVMIDTLLDLLPAAGERRAAAALGLSAHRYGVVTLHRPANVDQAETLSSLLELLRELSGQIPLLFPVHPRTAKAAERSDLAELIAPGQPTFICIAPQPYVDHLSLMQSAALILTDSGGMQEESSVLGIPCLTLREVTERPITVDRGTCRLVGRDPERIRGAFADATSGQWPASRDIPLWDGHAGERAAAKLAAWLRT